MAWLLDTNILSELRRLRPEPKVLAFIADHPLDQLCISVVIIAATALHHGLTIVTRDRIDFEKAGAPVINPWEAT